MATEHENTSAEDQALADEWAAALEETGDVGQDDIDALLAADAATVQKALANAVAAQPAWNRTPAASRAGKRLSTVCRAGTSRSS